jgi:hypothetical protein
MGEEKWMFGREMNVLEEKRKREMGDKTVRLREMRNKMKR